MFKPLFPETRTSLVAFLAFAVCLTLSSEAMASGITSSMGNALCTVVGYLLGNIGRSIAIIGIITLGIGAMLGKISWGMGLIVCAGISIVFGAPSLFNTIVPGYTANPDAACM